MRKYKFEYTFILIYMLYFNDRVVNDNIMIFKN